MHASARPSMRGSRQLLCSAQRLLRAPTMPSSSCTPQSAAPQRRCTALRQASLPFRALLPALALGRSRSCRACAAMWLASARNQRTRVSRCALHHAERARTAAARRAWIGSVERILLRSAAASRADIFCIFALAVENNAATLVPLALTALEANREHTDMTHTLIVRSALLLVCAAADMALANKAHCPHRLHPVARSSARVR